MNFKRSFSQGPVGRLYSAIIGTIFCFIFLSIGISMILSGYVRYIDSNVYAATPITSVDNIKEGQVVKLCLKAKPVKTIESFQSKLPCVYYITRYLRYNRYTEGILMFTIDNVIKKPNNIILESGGKDYSFSLLDPMADLFFNKTFTFIKNVKTNVYEPTTKIEFATGDYVIEENVIFPSENVIVFGKVNKIIPDSYNNITKIEFTKIEFIEPLENFAKCYYYLFKAIFEKDVSHYVISTKDDVSLEKELKLFDRTGSQIILGFVMCLIFVVILISSWSLFMKSLRF
ncbi:MAG: hypothetical protein AB7V50_09975 [Vampirovibrionia bacterium]